MRHLMMLVFGTAVRMRFGRSVVAILQSRNSCRIGSESKQHNVIHQFPVLRNLCGNTVSRPRAIRSSERRLPSACIALLVCSLDPAFDLVDATEIFLEPLPIRKRKPLLQRPSVFEYRIDHPTIASVSVGAEQLIES